jgi:hypothetical protein
MLHRRVFTDAYGSGYSSLGVHERAIWVAQCFISEVDNGGFHQFFWNSDGDYSDQLSGVLDAVGAVKMRQIYERAARILSPNGSVPTDRRARQEALDRLGDKRWAVFEQVEHEFYGLSDADHPDLLEYALSHSDRMDFSAEEVRLAVEQEPFLLFPGDRRVFARFDLDKKEIEIADANGLRRISLGSLESLSIVKGARLPQGSGLYYRLRTKEGITLVPYFARGEGIDTTVIWFFDLPRKSGTRILGPSGSLKEARSDEPMLPILLWRGSFGSRYLE